MIYFVFFSQQQQHSRFGFSCCGFLVVELLLLLFVCLFLGITVCSMSSVSGFVFFLVFGMCVL